jgi:hypothetical protein
MRGLLIQILIISSMGYVGLKFKFRLSRRRVGGFIVEIDGDRAVLAFGFGGLRHVSSPCRRWWVRMRHSEVNVLKWQADRERSGASPLNPLECDKAKQQVVYLGYADKYLGPLASRLSDVNQPVSRTPKRFSTFPPRLLANI